MLWEWDLSSSLVTICLRPRVPLQLAKVNRHTLDPAPSDVTTTHEAEEHTPQSRPDIDNGVNNEEIEELWEIAPIPRKGRQSSLQYHGRNVVGGGHLSAEVTPCANTEFMNNRPLGKRAAVRDETSGFAGGQARGTAEQL